MADKNIKEFSYQGHTITFEFADGQRMVNATHMAKPFGKLVGGFLRTKQTKELIEVINSRYADLHNGDKYKALKVVQGGTPELQGTWMEERLALAFAAWLSPVFHLWIYDRMVELLTTGKTELPQQRPPFGVIKSIRLIADQLENQQLDISQNKEDIKQLQEVVTEIEAKVTTIDESYYSISGYCVLIGKECPQEQARRWGMAATKLSRAKGMPVGKAYDAKFAAVNTYHTSILEQIIK